MPTDEQVWQSIIVGLVDGALAKMGERELMPRREWHDLLLDIRLAASPRPADVPMVEVG